jgi:hypothetical protein
MSRQDEQEGVFFNLQAIPAQGISAALEDSSGTISNMRWIDETGAVITKAAAGQKVTLVVDWTAHGPNLIWKACCTVIEGVPVPLASAWKNYVQANSNSPTLPFGSTSMTKTNMKLNQMPGGSLIMPARDLLCVVKLWVRGDLVEDFPAVGDSWRN